MGRGRGRRRVRGRSGENRRASRVGKKGRGAGGHAPGLGVDLLVLHLVRRDGVESTVADDAVQDEPRRGGSLVDGADELGSHGRRVRLTTGPTRRGGVVVRGWVGERRRAARAEDRGRTLFDSEMGDDAREVRRAKSDSERDRRERITIFHCRTRNCRARPRPLLRPLETSHFAHGLKSGCEGGPRPRPRPPPRLPRPPPRPPRPLV